MIKLIVLFIVLLNMNAFALIESKRTLDKNYSSSVTNSLKQRKSLGHNSSPTTYVLSKDGVVLGGTLIAYGLTDNISIGFSPWMYQSYNFDNLLIRLGHRLNSEFTLGFQGMYLKSYIQQEDHSYLGGYQMESLRSHLILTQEWNDYLAIHHNINYEYFYDETVPHSLRREPLNNDPYQVGISSLFEFTVGESSLMNFEIGTLGLNYYYPQIIIGGSYGYKTKSAYAQFGISTTGTTMSYFSSTRIDNNAIFSQNKENMKVDFCLLYTSPSPRD